MDKTATGTGTNTVVKSGFVTTTIANELYVAVAWSGGNNNTWTAMGGYTKREEEINNNTYERHVSEDQIIVTATTTQGLFKTSASNAFAIALASFLPATTTTGGGQQGTSTPTVATLSFVHQDHLGSTNAVTDENGEVTQTLDYYPFGATRIESGEDVSQRKFIGIERDEETELDYALNRYYANQRGQFISQDPTFLSIGDRTGLQNLTGLAQDVILADPQQLNSYAYGRNNPVRFKDPKGLYAESGFDIAMLGISFATFANDPSWTNAAGVALDAGSLALPGIPAVGGLAIRGGKYADDAAEKTYQIYAKTKQGANGADEVYIGRTSGVRSSIQNVAARDANHHRTNQGFGPAQHLITTNSYNAVRGLEQLAQNFTKSLGQLTQQIRGVSPSNANLSSYLQAAQQQVGELQKAINKLLGK